MIKLKENNIYFHFNKAKLTDNFDNYKKLGNIYYPLKTNSNKNVLEFLSTLLAPDGNGFLISNIKHYEQLTEIGVNPNKMCLINVFAEDETIEFLYNKGVRYFTFDNLNALINFSKYANLNDCKVAIRLNTMKIFVNKFAHIGANPDDCISMFDYLRGKCNDYGISFYIQSNIKCEEKAFERILNYIANKFKDANLKFISIAGVKRAHEINADYLKRIKEELNINEIILEPGKYLVGDTIDMETKIIRTKILNDKFILIIKNGIYSGFFDVLLYDEKFELYLETKNDGYVKFNYEKMANSDCEVNICGGSSDSGDVLGQMYIEEKYKKELVEGKNIVVKNIGAYFEEFFMPYGGDINKVYI
jgi:diaminopimelate decarboxylase